MRTITTTKTVFNFDELSEAAKNRARDKYREGGMDYEWWDCIYEEVKTAGAILGIDIDKIYFSGFSSQGDGACFEGNYSYAPRWRELLKQEFGGDLLAELLPFGEQLQELQRRTFYSITASTRQSGHYMHSNCMSVNVEMNDNISQETFSEIESDVISVLRGYADYIYRKLESEYDYLTSDEAIDETIEANEWEFDEHGNMA